MQHLSLDADCPPPRAYGRRTRVGAPRRCRRCNRPVDPLARAHLCKPCIRAASRGLTPEGPCAVCGLRDRRVLSVAELEAGPVILCANDKALLGPGVATVPELVAEAALAPPRAAGAGLLDELLDELAAA